LLSSSLGFRLEVKLGKEADNDEVENNDEMQEIFKEVEKEMTEEQEKKMVTLAYYLNLISNLTQGVTKVVGEVEEEFLNIKDDENEMENIVDEKVEEEKEENSIKKDTTEKEYTKKETDISFVDITNDENNEKICDKADEEKKDDTLENNDDENDAEKDTLENNDDKNDAENPGVNIALVEAYDTLANLTKDGAGFVGEVEGLLEGFLNIFGGKKNITEETGNMNKTNEDNIKEDNKTEEETIEEEMNELIEEELEKVIEDELEKDINEDIKNEIDKIHEAESNSTTSGGNIISGLFKTLHGLTQDVSSLVSAVEEVFASNRKEVVRLADDVEENLVGLSNGLSDWAGNLENGTYNISNVNYELWNVTYPNGTKANSSEIPNEVTYILHSLLGNSTFSLTISGGKTEYDEHEDNEADESTKKNGDKHKDNDADGSKKTDENEHEDEEEDDTEEEEGSTVSEDEETILIKW